MKIPENKKPLILRRFEDEMQRLWEETNGCDAAYIFGHPVDRWINNGGLRKIKTIDLAMRRPPSPWFFEFGKTIFPRIVHPTALPKFNHRFSFFVAYSDAIQDAWQKYSAWILETDAAFRTAAHAAAKQLPDLNEKLETWIKLHENGCD